MNELHLLLYVCPLLFNWFIEDHDARVNEKTENLANGLREAINHFDDEFTSLDACSWEVWESDMPNRIPSKITEIHCKEEGSTCHQNTIYEVDCQLFVYIAWVRRPVHHENKQLFSKIAW